MGAGVSKPVIKRTRWTAFRTFLAFALAAMVSASCRGRIAKRGALAPRLPLESVLGSYSGSISTARGVQAVVLEIQDIAPAPGGFAFRYTLNIAEQREEGLGTFRPEETSTRVCFAEEVCGWLLSEGGSIRIAADSGDLDAPSWSLEKP
jgi:hypothetical protein